MKPRALTATQSPHAPQNSPRRIETKSPHRHFMRANLLLIVIRSQYYAFRVFVFEKFRTEYGSHATIHSEKGLIAVFWDWETAILPRCLRPKARRELLLTRIRILDYEYEYLTVARRQVLFEPPVVSGCKSCRIRR